MSRVLKLILGATLVGPAVMAAQPTQQPPTAAPAPGAAPPSDADVSVRQRPTITPEEMMAQSRDYRARMDSLIKQVQALIEKSREAKDVIRINCLTDKLAQLKANLVVADNGLQSLADAIGRRDEGQSAHEYSKITIVKDKAQVLGAEAQACVGEDLSYVGASVVEVEDLNDPGDPTKPWPGHDLHPAVDRPPSASPYI